MKSRVVVFVLCFSLATLAADKPRVYIDESQSWEVGSSAGGADGTFGGTGGGGARPQTAEIIKTFGQRCSNVIINNRSDKADYVVLLQHEGGKAVVLHDNKVAVFNRDGDTILSHSTITLGNAVSDACSAITKDWTAHPAVNAAVTPGPAAESTDTKVDITSTPVGADIEVNGKFVGNTPSSIHLDPGEYTIAVKKDGYAGWERSLKITGGNVNLVAELQKQ